MQDMATAAPTRAPSPEPDEPVGNREQHTHPKLPYSYEMVKVDKLHHVVERKGKPVKKLNVITRLRKKWAMYKRLLPLFIRFSRENILPLGRLRIAFYMVSSILEAQIPDLQWRARTSLAQILQKALEERVLDKVRFFKLLGFDLACWATQKAITKPMEANRARLEYRFRKLIQEHIMEARSALDALTAESEETTGKFNSAKKLLAQNWRDSFILEHVVRLTSQASSLVTLGLSVRRLSSPRTARIAQLSFLAAFVRTLRNYLWVSSSYKFEHARTNADYKRMTTMSRLAEDAGAQDQVLGLQRFYLQEYHKAAAKVGDVSDTPPDVFNRTYGNAISEHFWMVMNQVVDPALDFLFANSSLKFAAANKMNVQDILNDYHTVKHSTRSFSTGLFDMVDYIRDFAATLRPVEDFYKLSEIKSLLKRRSHTVPYGLESFQEAQETETPDPVSSEVSTIHSAETNSGVEDIIPADVPSGPTGMRIEFRNVSFTYPNTKKKAVQDLSFTISSGALCSIVGASGSGKSTLIGLIVRLHDPDEGQILVNGRDVQEYEPDDLYMHIAMLFQTTDIVPVTIREFIGLGNVRKINDEEAIIEAAKASGAWPIIEKLKYGLDTELRAPHMWDMEVPKRLLLKRVQKFDEWDEEQEKKDMEDDSTSKADDKEEEEGEKDHRTDAEVAQHARTFYYVPQDPKLLLIWTEEAADIPLPMPNAREEEKLSADYDVNKLDNNDVEESARFSRGEWAKVVLARLFLRRSADLAIIDEYSAALDPESEAQIFKQIMHRRGDQTIIGITHRYHLAARSDWILFLKGGKLVEQGTHAELMTRRGEYHKMYTATQSDSSGVEIACQTDPVGVVVGEIKQEVAMKEGAEEQTAQSSSSNYVIATEPPASSVDPSVQRPSSSTESSALDAEDGEEEDVRLRQDMQTPEPSLPSVPHDELLGSLATPPLSHHDDSTSYDSDDSVEYVSFSGLLQEAEQTKAEVAEIRLDGANSSDD